MSNRYDVSIAIKDESVLEAIRDAVAEWISETGDDGIEEILDSAEISQMHDYSGNDFLCLEWRSYNHWGNDGGDALLCIVREVASDYAYIAIDDYGEEEDGAGIFDGLFCIEKRISVCARHGLAKNDPLLRPHKIA